ncbi:MAG: hypothetical protein ACETVY_00730 [Candidatus Bathyarchaeia archaeon]
MSTRRKMLAADEDIANKIVEMAKRREWTVYQTVNEILEQALRADGMGLFLADVVDEREMIEKAKKMGFTFAVENLLYDVVDMAYTKDKKRLSEMWLDVGRWYGKFFSSRADDGVDAFSEAMSLLTLGNSVFTIERRKGNSVSVSCVGERFTPGFTEVYSLFMEGVFEALGMELVNKENSDGIIRLRFRKPR